jgi:hypothetical protein
MGNLQGIKTEPRISKAGGIACQSLSIHSVSLYSGCHWDI